MPIYCYKCDECGMEREHFAKSYEAVVAVRCPKCTCLMPRDWKKENPVMATDDGYRQSHVRTHDTGAGMTFETQAEYKQWQKENTKYGVTPEPLSKSETDDMHHHALTTMKSGKHESPMTDAEQKEAWMNDYHAVKTEEMAANRIVINGTAKKKKKTQAAAD